MLRCRSLRAQHVYAQPPDEAYLAMQRAFAASHPWFRVERVEATTHFPHTKEPEATAEVTERFVESLEGSAAAGGPEGVGQAAA